MQLAEPQSGLPAHSQLFGYDIDSSMVGAAYEACKPYTSVSICDQLRDARGSFDIITQLLVIQQQTAAEAAASLRWL